LDPLLSSALSLVAEFSLLKVRADTAATSVNSLQEHGISKIFYLAPDAPETDGEAVIYLCRARVESMEMIARIFLRAGQISTRCPGHVEKSNNAGEHHVYFVPRRTVGCERVLEEEGVFGAISIGEYHLDLVPLDTDVLSFEFGDSFTQLYAVRIWRESLF
jgi:hypothetical protein